MLPLSGSCKVAMVRISEDLPAPFGPSKPNIPLGISRLTSLMALTPLAYVLFSCLIDSMCSTLQSLGLKKPANTCLPVCERGAPLSSVNRDGGCYLKAIIYKQLEKK